RSEKERQDNERFYRSLSPFMEMNTRKKRGRLRKTRPPVRERPELIIPSSANSITFLAAAQARKSLSAPNKFFGSRMTRRKKRSAPGGKPDARVLANSHA